VRGVSVEGGEVIECDEAVWTAPANGILPSGLRFIHTVVYNVALRARRSLPYQWCYFGDPGICFSRLSVPRNFDPSMVPGGADGITAEITCTGDEVFWSDPAVMLPALIRDLERVGAAREEDILFVMPERVRETYPVYTLDYRERLEGVRPPAGLKLIGRCGSFWYNNMDHSISQALAAAEGGSVSRDFWIPDRP
jgi:protoporphyrinogen oxidase